MSTPSLVVFDDWISDPALLESLTSAVASDYEAKKGLPEDERYNWWNGDGASLPIHRYIQYTYEKLQPMFGLKSAGFEWWGNFNSMVGWHFDKDEYRFQKDKVMVNPEVGTVLYLTGTECIEGLGGAFAINSDPSEKTADHVYPVKNRLVAFRGNRLHRICEYRGRRVSLAVNFWAQTPLAFARASTAS